MLIGRQTYRRFKSSATGRVADDISTDHSANIFRVKLHCEDKSTTVFQNARNYTASQQHKDINLEQHLCENSNFIAIMKPRDTLPGDMKNEDVSKTTVVTFILFQRSAYRQVKNDTVTGSVGVSLNESKFYSGRN